MKEDPAKDTKKKEPVKQTENKERGFQKSNVSRRERIEQLCHMVLRCKLKLKIDNCPLALTVIFVTSIGEITGTIGQSLREWEMK